MVGVGWWMLCYEIVGQLLKEIPKQNLTTLVTLQQNEYIYICVGLWKEVQKRKGRGFEVTD